jgi:hypothetical protein
MADRNWEVEMQQIDKQLASLSDDQLRARPAAAPASAPPARATSAPVAVAPSGGAWWAYMRAGLAALGVAGLVLWPYARSCGPYGIAYLASAGVVALVGLWATVGSWKKRAALAHLVALGAVAGAGALAALEVLPKVGYAIPTALHGATWQCDAGAPLAPPGFDQPAPRGPSGPTPMPAPSGGPVKL